MSMKNAIFRLLGVNLVSTALNMITAFLLPKFLTIEGYGYVKTYQFYLMYVGLLHLGYIDGIYLEYGGKDYNNIDTRKVTRELYNFVLIQFLICILFLTVVLIKNNIVFWVLLFTILPYNFITYVRMFLQATGEFKRYSKILLLTTCMLFLVNVGLISLKKEYIYFIVSYCIIYYILMLASVVLLKEKVRIQAHNFDISCIKKYITSGMPLMIGNFAGVLYTGLDRWVIQICFDINYFAYYSFTVSIMNMLETFLSPITITLYNYFSLSQEKESYKSVKSGLTILGFGLLSGMFFIKKIIQLLLPKYILSINICFILSVAYILMTIIKGVYINLYKVQKKQKIYLVKMVIALMVELLLNWVAVIFFHTSESVAFCTILGVVFWEYLCLKDYPELKATYAELFYKVFLIILFLMFGFFLSAEWGFVLYLAFYVSMSFLIYRKQIDLQKIFFRN